MLTRLNALPSAVSEGHILGVPLSDRYCGLGAIESLSHIVFECPWYIKARQKWIKPLTLQWTESSVDILVPKLLADSRVVTLPNFLVQVMRIWATC